MEHLDPPYEASDLFDDDDSFLLDDPPADDANTSSALLECSFSSIVPSEELAQRVQLPQFAASTPSRQNTAQQPLPAPAVPPSAPQPPERLPCPDCNGTFANQRTLTTHRKLHVGKEAVSHLPGKPEVVELTKEALLKTLKQVQREEEKSGSPELLQYCILVEQSVASGEREELINSLSKHFFDVLKSRNTLIPSALRHTVHLKSCMLLNSEEFVLEMQGLLGGIDCEPLVLQSFIGNVFLEVFNWQLVLCLRKIREQYRSNAPQVVQYSTNALHPGSYHQLVYYIGGAILSGVTSKAKRQPENSEAVLRGAVVEKKLLCAKVNSKPVSLPAGVSNYTAEKDRGGLKYCNQETFDFFVLLFEIIFSVEGSDGSLPPETIEEKVFSHDILIFMWDELVGRELNEDQSLHLFTDIVHCCTKVAGNGIKNRRLNEALTKSYTSMNLRHQVTQSRH